MTCTPGSEEWSQKRFVYPYQDNHLSEFASVASFQSNRPNPTYLQAHGCAGTSVVLVGSTGLSLHYVLILHVLILHNT